MFNVLKQCIFGPALLKIYKPIVHPGYSGSLTISNIFEAFGNFGDKILSGIAVLYNVGLYTSPLVVGYFYKHDYVSFNGCLSFVKLATGLMALYFIGMVVRGFGRYYNPTYLQFAQILINAEQSHSVDNMAELSNYDFDFWAWPMDYKVQEKSPNFEKISTNAINSSLSFLWPTNLAAYVCMHAFGRHLIYPGSIQLLQLALQKPLIDGREKLIVSYKGKRKKVITADGNRIDTVFVDNRNSSDPNGKTLVICCEGNAGFYELGMMTTAIEAGYSVIGWNHPGFAGSSGLPFPDQEMAAADSVVQMAVKMIGFSPENILIYAWSIGGFTGSFIARIYPTIKGLILDATFDDIVPMAIPRMPACMSGIVELSVRNHMNLNVIEHLKHYSGPLTIIRRTMDEIITTIEGQIHTNRANDLLFKLLTHRYPYLTNGTNLKTFLRLWVDYDEKTQEKEYELLNIDEEVHSAKLASYIDEYGDSLPVQIGTDYTDEDKKRMILFIANKILTNWSSGHQNALPAGYLVTPWNQRNHSDYVKV